ncbi:MAG TPA: CoA pyrophosphatase [Trueperaceae bacterium]
MSGARPTLEQLRQVLGRNRPERLEIAGYRRAAVLVPVLDGPEGLELLFTVRGEELRHHAGQVAFPGGRVEEGESVEEAALRETFEEIGVELPPSAIIGRLDDHPSPARFVATPLVAVLDWPQALEPNPSEVAEVFSVPLAELFGIVPRWEKRVLEGLERRIHFYAWGERLIWGFTGNVVKDLLDLMPRDETEIPSLP